jgi:DNA-binding MarR family transcriptional regulator
MKPLDEAAMTSVDRVWRTIDVFRDVNGDMSVEEIRAFLTISRKQGLSVQDLADELGVPQSSASRYVKALSARRRSHWAGNLGFMEAQLEFVSGGYGLVEQRINEIEPRKRSLVLTDQGHAVVRRILDTAAPDLS